MTETITIKPLASKAGMEERDLRRLLRDKFPRKEKGKAYEWEANDPQLELIIKAAADRKARTKVTYNTSEPKATKPTAKKNVNKPVKKQPKTQKLKVTKTTDTKQKGGEADGDSAANS